MKKTIAFVGIGILLVIAGLVATRSSKKTQKPPSSISTQETVTPQAPAAGSAENRPRATPSEASPAEIEVRLVVSSPINGATVTTPSLVVKGTTAPKADVYVNDRDTVADAKGNFSIPILLDEGENFLMVTVVDPDGNTAEKEITVTYDAGQ